MNNAGEYKDVMVDIETWGSEMGSALMSIGACAFAPGKPIGETFHAIVSLESCLRYDMTISPKTMAWWLSQSEEARATMELSAQGRPAPGQDWRIHINDVLCAFDEFLERFGTPNVWGNGADFDNAMLINAAHRTGYRYHSWTFRNNRCYRTLKSLVPGVVVPQVGTPHNALDDAVFQAKAATLMLERLGYWQANSNQMEDLLT